MSTLKELSDAQLATEFIAGNNAAFGVLSERHRPRIRTAIATKIPDKHTIDDLTQDTILKIFIKMKEGTYVEKGTFKAWALRIAENLAIDYFRALGRGLQVVELWDFNTGIEEHEDSTISNRVGDNLLCESYEVTLIERDNYNFLKRSMQLLPSEQKEVLFMRHYCNMCFKDIALVTGANINTALGRSRYGLNNLRRMYDIRTRQMHSA